jgi:hypothetical protein
MHHALFRFRALAALANTARRRHGTAFVKTRETELYSGAAAGRARRPGRLRDSSSSKVSINNDNAGGCDSGVYIDCTDLNVGRH